MHADIPTLFLLLTVISATLTVSIGLVARAQMRDGMVFWAWAFAFHTAGYFLYTLRGQISDVLSIVVANMVFSCHLALIAEGVLQFQNRRLPRVIFWLPVLIVAVVYTWLLPWQTARYLAGSIIFSAQCASIVVILLQRRKDTVGVGQYFVLTGYFILITALAAQAVGTLLQTEVSASLLLPSPVTTLTFMAAGISTLLSCLGLIVMTKERADERNRTLAMRDEVTGLLNRRVLLEALTQHLSAAKRHGQPLSVLLLDIDFFKRVNDTYGHLSGDKVLRVIAGVLQERIREQDYLGRFGGEEFLMILPNTDTEGASTMAETLRRTVETHSFEAVSGEPIAITVSIGVCALSQLPDARCDDLIGAADKALYRAKESGRNCIAAWA